MILKNPSAFEHAMTRAVASRAMAVIPLLLVASTAETPAGQQRPNVVLIITDDQGYGDLSAHGNPYLKTPNLDKLHSESVRLTNFHVDPSCSPTRAALLTGQYSSRSGVWHTIGGRSLLRKDKLTMADVFKNSGYTTGWFGKWHLGENFPFRPKDRGFDEEIVHGAGATTIHPDYWGNKYFDDVFKHNGVFKRFEGYNDDVWFEQGLRFIKENQDDPFFVVISTNIPHAPLLVEEKYSEPYKAELSDRIANYYGMIAKHDENIGKFLMEIENMNLDENTIVIWMTDNGPCHWFGGCILDDDLFVKEGYNAGMRGGKIRGYEGAHRVPIFLRWPSGGLNQGTDVDKLTAHFDILPTLIDLIGLEAPEDVEFDGVSLKPLLENPETHWPDRTLFIHNQRLMFPEKHKDFQVLTEEWRLEGREQRELYHIRNDPGQKTNVADQHPDLVAELTRKYEAWWEDVSVDFDHYNPFIIGNKAENPTLLYSHDALRGEGELIWAVDVDQEGLYEIHAYRWPVESGRKIVESQGPDFRHSFLPTSTMNSDRHALDTGDQGSKSEITKAHLIIGNLERELEVTETMRSASFLVYLEPGKTSMKAWFSGDRNFQANYVRVERIGPVGSTRQIEDYQPVHPDQWLRPE